MNNDKEVLAQNITNVQTRIAEAAYKVGRKPQDITLIAVSKTQPIELIQDAYHLGLRHFGENRVQEAIGKISAFQPSDIHWHLIGHLQTNKANKTVGQFSYIHSIDSFRLAEALNRQIEQRMPEHRQLILLQVNIAGETSKEGVSAEEAFTLTRQIQELPHLEIHGLMTIAPLVEDPEEARTVFRDLRILRDRLRDTFPQCSWHHLSMGMTDDYHVAIEEGATIVRIGRAIFGERSKLTKQITPETMQEQATYPGGNKHEI